MVISLIALFVALGGTAYASALISGKQIVNHSIPAKKLTAAAITALRGMRGPTGPTGPQGPGAIFINKRVTFDDGATLWASFRGVDVYYHCSNLYVAFELWPNVHSDTVNVSGDQANDGTLTSVQTSGKEFFATTGQPSTVNLDVIAWRSGVGKTSRFDLGGSRDHGGCNIWGLITPGQSFP